MRLSKFDLESNPCCSFRDLSPFLFSAKSVQYMRRQKVTNIIQVDPANVVLPYKIFEKQRKTYAIFHADKVKSIAK